MAKPQQTKQTLSEAANQLLERLDPQPTAPLDPVEAAKGGASTSDPATGAQRGAQGQETPLPQAGEEPKLPPPGPAPVLAPVYVVQNGPITVSWGAQQLILRTGDELSEDSYGDGAIARIEERGVKLTLKQ